MVDPPLLPAGLSPEEQRLATRAMRGRVLRAEVFSDDDPADVDADHELTAPYTVSESTFEVRQLQPAESIGLERESRLPAVWDCHQQRHVDKLLLARNRS